MYRSLVVKLLLGLISYATFAALEDCSNFQGEMGCKSGTQTTNPPEWAERSFQTFLPGDPMYKPSYEGLGRIMCYSNIVYNAARTSATVEMRCRQHSSITKVEYNFNN